MCFSDQVWVKEHCHENQLRPIKIETSETIWKRKRRQDISCLNLRATSFQYAPFTVKKMNQKGDIIGYEGHEVTYK